MAHRTVRRDGTIIMGKPFANGATIVELRRHGQPPVRVLASALNALYKSQQAAYAAEATLKNDVWVGPSGRIRVPNRIRVVDVTSPVMPTPPTSKPVAAA